MFAVQIAKQTDANTELKEPRHTNLQWFVITLLAFTIIDYLCLPRLG